MGKHRGGWFLVCLLFFLMNVMPIGASDLVKEGMKGSEVKQIQQLLAGKGYYREKPNGIYDKNTVQAVKAFQLDHGLEADGVTGKLTKEALKKKNRSPKKERSVETLLHFPYEPGDRGDSVLQLQGYLLKSGYILQTYDGIYGNDTKKAVEEFQKRRGMKQTGVIDETTYRALRVIPGTPKNYKKKLLMHVSAYSSEDDGNGLYTARGNRLTQGLVAVDPNVIPLGSVLYIEGYGYAVADDTGGAIVGNTVDIGMNSRQDALQWGRRDVMVYIIR